MSHILISTEKTDYTGGEIVNGKVTLYITEALPIRGIRIHFKGYERSHWRRGGGKSRTIHTETRNFFDEEKIIYGEPSLNMTEVLADVVKGIFSKDQYEIMERGKYEWDFSYRLPLKLPADFESPVGSSCIRYEIEAYVDIPLKLDISAVQRLTIYENYDMTKVKPASAENSKTFLLDPSNPINMRAAIEKNMFFPGDHVRGFLELTNYSEKKLNAINISLVQQTVLKAGNSTTTQTHPFLLKKIEEPVIITGQPYKLDIGVDIPNDVYCSVTNSELVRVFYNFVVHLNIPWAIDLKTEIPVTILEKAGMPSGMKKKG